MVKVAGLRVEDELLITPESRLTPSSLLTHAMSTAKLALVISRLPVLELTLSRSPGGNAIISAARGVGVRRPLRGLGRSAFLIPSSGVIFQGRRAHGRRNLANRALREGLAIRSTTPDEYAHHVARMGYEPLTCYSCAGLWLIGLRDKDVITATHVHLDGRVGQLGGAIHHPNDPLTGSARYAMFRRTVSELAEREVGILLALDNYFTLPPGLRTFQRTLGFTPVNLCIKRSSRLAGSYAWRRSRQCQLDIDRGAAQVGAPSPQCSHIEGASFF